MRYTIDEITVVYNRPLLDLIFHAAAILRQNHPANEIQTCHLISIKTGGCPEDCKYCAQSSRYQTSIQAQSFMEVDQVVALAKSAKEKGITRVCLGAAWREVRLSPQFDRVLEMIRQIAQLGIEVCCCLGMLNEEAARRLEVAGLTAYNHNLDTSEKFYSQIITTRTYQDRLKTLDIVQKTKITTCSGGILGMGESPQDRISLIHTLANRDPYPDSITINILTPIPGTPLADQPRLETIEVLRTIATARITMPKAMVRISAGRVELTLYEQALCFLAGANSIFVGDKLLTVPNPSLDEDEKTLALLGLTKRPPFKCAN